MKTALLSGMLPLKLCKGPCQHPAARPLHRCQDTYLLLCYNEADVMAVYYCRAYSEYNGDESEALDAAATADAAAARAHATGCPVLICKVCNKHAHRAWQLLLHMARSRARTSPACIRSTDCSCLLLTHRTSKSNV